MVPIHVDPAKVPTVVDSHILFLNSCMPSGCVVHTGSPDSRIDSSDILGSGGTHTLSAFAAGPTVWSEMMTCVKSVMSPFNITVTDVDPGNVDHFEVMVAGTSGEGGLMNGYLGIADYPCQGLGQCAPYLPDALVFAFANSIGNDPNYLCGVAAQEIAHAWTLDHTTLANDPMTYKNYVSPLAYRNGAPCGSDCQYNCPSGSGVCDSFGVQCTGSGLSGTHACLENNAATQDELTIIQKLFGPAGAQAPTLTVTDPIEGAAVESGFSISATCTSSDGIQEVDMSFDGAPKASLSAPPFTFTAPSGLTDGPHKVTILCATKLQATATVTADVIVGQKCSSDSDCTQANYICYGGACVAGPNATGGLGATCTGNTACDSQECASDGTTMQCVLPCDTTNSSCPGGFGCLQVGSTGTSGVCWAGAGGGGGGCAASGRGTGGGAGGGAGLVLFGFGIAAAFVTRGRKRVAVSRSPR